MMPRFILWMSGVCAAITGGAIAYGVHGMIPLLIWIPLVLMVTNLGLMLGVLFFSWAHDHENKLLIKAGDVLAISQFTLMTLTILALLAKAGPL